METVLLTGAFLGAEAAGARAGGIPALTARLPAGLDTVGAGVLTLPLAPTVVQGLPGPIGPA